MNTKQGSLNLQIGDKFNSVHITAETYAKQQVLLLIKSQRT